MKIVLLCGPIEAQETDREICGALIGIDGVVMEAVPLSNQSDDPRRRFLIPATEVLRLERAAESSGRMLLGFYHSHAMQTIPSPTDLELALPGYIYLIVSRGERPRAWHLRDDRSGFDEIKIDNSGER
jgi:desampylase